MGEGQGIGAGFFHTFVFKDGFEMSRRYYLFMLLALCGGLRLAAQGEGQWRFGPLLGVNLARLQGKDAESDVYTYYARPLLQVGGLADYRLSERGFYLSSGLIYSQKGARREDFDFSHRLDYVVLPLSLLYERGGFGADLGGELAFLSAAHHRDVPDNVLLADGLFDRRTDLGLSLGGRYTVGPFQLWLRYVHGLLPTSSITYTDAQGQWRSEGDWYNRSLGFGVRWLVW